MLLFIGIDFPAFFVIYILLYIIRLDIIKDESFNTFPMKTIFKSLTLLGLTLLIPCFSTYRQLGVNTDNSAPDNSAMLDVQSTTKGTLLPRMTFEQRNAIMNPVEGLIVYCTNCNADGTGLISIYQGGIWKLVDLICKTPNQPTEGVHIPSAHQIVWKWKKVPIATGYKWSTTNNYIHPLINFL
jgi:hypothetical protein